MTSEIDRRPDREALATVPPSALNGAPCSYDRLLLEVAHGSSAEAFTALFSHFKPRVEAYLRRLGALPAQAEDLAQEVMLIVWQFDARRAAAGAWIFAIARHRLVDLQRRNGLAKVALDHAAVADITGSEADETFYLSELERRMRQAMTALPREQAELLRGGYYADKSQSALADEHQLPLGTIKSRQRLALAKLRRLLVELR